MKKRLRQVQLDMTKLRARQAEVTKEVQKTPVSGEHTVGSFPFWFDLFESIMLNAKFNST